MSLVDVERVNMQLAKFNENLQKVVLKTKVIIGVIMKKDKKISASYNGVPDLLDLAIKIIQGRVPLPGFDRIYGTICGFFDKYLKGLENGIDLFDMIHDKDDRILTHHLSALFPKNEYVDKIQYLYGANPEKKIYVDADDIEFIWKFINGVMHRAIKWVLFSQDSRYIGSINPNVVQKYGINMNN